MKSLNQLIKNQLMELEDANVVSNQKATYHLLNLTLAVDFLLDTQNVQAVADLPVETVVAV